MPFDASYRRTVEETFIGDGGALERGLQLHGKDLELWIQSAEGKGVFKKIEVRALLYYDTTAPKTLVGSDQVFSVDATLIVRSTDLPRRPLTGELLHYPRNSAWIIAESIDEGGFYQIALNRASSG